MAPPREAVLALALGVALTGCGATSAQPHQTGDGAEGWVSRPVPKPPPAQPRCEDGPGRDYSEEVKRLFSLVTCADGAASSTFDLPTAAAHCKKIHAKIESHRSSFVAPAAPFFAEVTAGTPDVVVYPFSGGDLVTALTTFPHAREITTISLELAGDPNIRLGARGNLAQSLEKVRREAGELLVNERYSRSATLKKTQLGALPGPLSMFLLGLAVHGYEPVDLRYFTLRGDGSVQYLSDCDIQALGDRGTRRKGTWLPPDFSDAFANAELRFRRAGDANAPIVVHRHVAANLNDSALRHSRSLLRHLEAKGSVSAMTKAASYLLWSGGYTMIRDYLLEHLRVMVSDSTGIPPAYTAAHELQQQTYGAFSGSLLPASAAHNRAFRKLWRSQPRRPLPFRYGYLSGGQAHLVVTSRATQ